MILTPDAMGRGGILWHLRPAHDRAVFVYASCVWSCEGGGLAPVLWAAIIDVLQDVYGCYGASSDHVSTQYK